MLIAILSNIVLTNYYALYYSVRVDL